MELLWFCLVAFMLVMYVVLDGFDLGAGVAHLFVARTNLERRSVLHAIGPVWDGNEVWLIAAGGTLYFAFPVLYASSFSGFYLPLIIVLWLLMLRGLGIEFRGQVDHPLWRSFWDGVFALGSALLAIVLGAALGNVVRGVPLGPDGYFFEPLWTSFAVVPVSGILDWFTTALGMVSLCTLTVHGANYLALKTEGELQARARALAGTAFWGVVGFSLIGLYGAFAIRPQLWDNFAAHPWGLLFPLGALGGLIGMRLGNRRGQDRLAFAASTAFIAGMLASTAFGMFPTMLASSLDPAHSLTVATAAAQPYALGVGLIWWSIGIVLALGYSVYLFRSFRGKVNPGSEGY